MDVPGIVESALEGEEIAADVSLGGENTLYVTPTRTLIYQSEGFLSDESVDEYPHDAQRMTVKEGRRKTRISLEYSLDGTEEFTVPSNATDDVLHPVLAGVLNATGVTDADETVTRTFRLDELTLVITSERLVKHVGSAVWDEDYEEYHFADVTGLDFEDGSVATQLVLTVGGRPERVKISNDRAAEVEEYLQRSLFSYYGVTSLDALNAAVAPEEPEEAERADAVDFGEGVDPLDAGNTVQPEEGGEAPGQEPAGQSLEHQPAGDANDPAGAGEPAGAADPTPEQPREPVDATGQAQADTGQHDSGQAGSEAGQGRTEPEPATETTPEPPSSQPPQEGTSPEQEAGTRSASPAESEGTNQPSEPAAEGSPATEPDRGSASADTPESTPTEVASAVDDAVAEDDAVTENDDADEDLADSKFEAAGFQPATSAGDEALLERIETLEAKVEHQNELLEHQHDLLQQLVDELSRNG